MPRPTRWAQCPRAYSNSWSVTEQSLRLAIDQARGGNLDRRYLPSGAAPRRGERFQRGARHGWPRGRPRNARGTADPGTSAAKCATGSSRA
jgi:hypothetical protein